MPWHTPRDWTLGELATDTMLDEISDDLNYLYALYNALVATVTEYAVTLTDVGNTTSLTTTMAFTVPANAWASKQLIEVTAYLREKNNEGTSNTTTYGFTAGAGSNAPLLTESWGDSATEFINERTFTFQRSSSLVVGRTISTRLNSSTLTCVPLTNTPATSTPTNFTSDFSVAVTVTFDTANANYYTHPIVATALHFRPS